MELNLDYIDECVHTSFDDDGNEIKSVTERKVLRRDVDNGYVEVVFYVDTAPKHGMYNVNVTLKGFEGNDMVFRDLFKFINEKWILNKLD